MGPRTFLTVQEFLWYNCSAVCGTSAQQLYGGVNGDFLQEGLRHRLCDPGSCTQNPCPCSRPLLTHTITGDTQTQFWLSLFGVSGSWCTQAGCTPETSEHLWWVRGLIPNMILPFLPSCRGFSFALGHGVSFFGGIQHSLVDSCSAVSCCFGILTREEDNFFRNANISIGRA